MALRIEDYAIVGDCETAALVSREGSIDWLCFPRFDSGACFAALLGTPDHGRWLIAPKDPAIDIRRRYLDKTLILETTFTTEEGEVSVIDFMPVREREPDLVRIVVGKRGHVRMRMELVIRFDYGSAVPWVRQLEGHRGIRATAGPDTVYCRTSLPLHGENLTTVVEFDVSPGDRVPFTLAWGQTHHPEPQEREAEQALAETQTWWTEWSDRCTYDGPWKEKVLRSLITLKALTYAPTGGIVAAATTSLPELIGGVRNWDYRFCWLRDATFTLMALNVGGYTQEAAAWRTWLLNAVAGTPQDMQIMYGVAGERRLTELTLHWLPGYEQSKPVRIGNEAYRQHQLDVYGEVADALFQSKKMGLTDENDEAMWRIELQLVHFVEKRWRDPDEGIWEIRGPRKHFTHSKVMAWVVLDRAIRTAETYGQPGELDRWRAVRDEIHAEVCEKGYDRDLNAFTQYYGSKEPDASLLMLPLVGFIPATDPRMVGTVELIQKRLVHDGFVQRYPTETGVDGLPGDEGAFLICTFWLVDNLALMGRKREARKLFERLLSVCNDVGLLAEEFDPAAGRQLGNFPQAFSHVGLINSARNLASAGGPAEDRQHDGETVAKE